MNMWRSKELMKTFQGLLFGMLILMLVTGCDRLVQGVAGGIKAGEIQGTWEFAFVRGGIDGEREIEKELSGTLILSSDLTFSNEQIVSGSDGSHDIGHGTWIIEDTTLVLQYEERNRQPYYGEARIEIAGNELILGDFEAEGFVFVYLRK